MRGRMMSPRKAQYIQDALIDPHILFYIYLFQCPRAAAEQLNPCRGKQRSAAGNNPAHTSQFTSTTMILATNYANIAL
ncbi:hypothetical protein CFK37_17155 [Virgibacillus phasianinus]|uniref:Uncharacterized protein n=1 Tax=Virgibacillus phasianinus TaxID=2017483 RepID=A0A220U7D5_9BACI|nr:hypothetical protein CFK37_17155 [Virgibacillus phasianinus]